MPKRILGRFLALCVLCTVSTAAALGGDDTLIVVKAGRVITVSGEEHAPGTIVIEDGKITAVGGDIEYPPSARVIDAGTETVTPGFVLPKSRYELATYSRSGVHGDQTASSDVYPSQLRYDHLLKAGYTTICYVPAGTGIPGVASVYRTGGPDATRLVRENAYLHVVPKWRAGGKSTLRKALKKAEEEIEKVEKARKEWDEKQKKKDDEQKESSEEEEVDEESDEEDDGDDSTPGAKRRVADEDGDEDEQDSSPADVEGEEEEEEFEPPKIDPAHQPLVDLIQHKEGARMMVTLTRASDLRHFDDVMKAYEDLDYVLYLATARSTDYHHVVEALGERQASVTLRPWIHFLPQTTFRYNVMAKLVEAGCSVAVIPWSDDRVEFGRVRARLADLVRAGLSRESALKSLTLAPAEAIGLGDQIGSIEKEKAADLVFFDGDPIDPHAQVRRVMILGEIVWTQPSEEDQR